MIKEIALTPRPALAVRHENPASYAGRRRHLIVSGAAVNRERFEGRGLSCEPDSVRFPERYARLI